MYVKNKKVEIEKEDNRLETNSVNSNSTILLSDFHSSLVNNETSQINEIVDNNSAISIAEILNNLSENEAILFFSVTNDVVKLGEIFSYLLVDHRTAIILTLGKKKLSQVISYVKDDDLADYISDTPRYMRLKVAAIIPLKRRKTIEKLVSYSDDTVGSIMTTEYLSVSKETTIQDVFKKIKREGEWLETVRTVYVVDNNNKLIGLKRLEEIIFIDEKKKMEEIMDTDFAYISSTADKEEAIPICKKYDLATLPVISKNGELVGIITFDDVLDVIEEESTEDILLRAGIAPTSKSYMETKPFRMALSYVIWLIIIALINTFSSVVVSYNSHLTSLLSVLIIFFPILNDTGGNSGDQTTSTITRALATNEITTKDYLKVASKELIVGFISAIIIGVFNFGWTQFEFHSHLISLEENQLSQISTTFGSISKGYLMIGLIVSLALVFSITLSKVLGATLPIVTKQLKLDPAVISGPLIACLMDIFTLIIYFALAGSFINGFNPDLLGVSL